MSKALRASLVVAACAAATGGGWLYRGGRRNPPAPLARRPVERLILLGFDGADPDLIEILVAQGKLPAMKRLGETGAYGRLRSFSPTKSAILWTSVATGKTMLKHGIIDWTYVNRMGLQVPYQDRARKVKTYWEILSERGVRTATMNWWMSYPPPPILNGYIVSNAFRHTPERNTVHPQRIYDSISPLRIDASQAGAEMKRLGIPAWRAEDATIPPGSARGVLDAYRLYVSQDVTVDRVSDYMFEHHPVEVFSTYFRLVDVTSHFAVHFADRKVYDAALDLEKAGRLTPEARARIDAEFARVTAPVYQFMDGIIQKYLGRLDGRTALIVCSDHGFDFFRGGYAHAHKAMAPPDGVVFFSGPGVRKGHRLAEAVVFDIAPTILHALGHPVAADMDGSVLSAALENEHLRRHPVRSIASYESQGRKLADAAPQRPEMDKEVLEDLKTLGYIQGGGDPATK